jgi:uncharacterized protein YjdB
MKKIFTTIMAVFFVMAIYSASKAQTTLNVGDGHPFATIPEAILAIVADTVTYPPADPILIKVNGEGYTAGYDEEGTPIQSHININAFSVGGYDVTIEGDGADVTVIKGFASEDLMPSIIMGSPHNRGIRFLTTHSGGKGLNLTFKNMKFQYWGYGNAAGGVFNINQGSAGGMKLSFINVEFEHFMAKIGAIVQTNQNNNEVLFDNVLVRNSITFDHNGMNGLFHLLNQKSLVIRNSTFMSNESFPYNLLGDNAGTSSASNVGTLLWIRHRAGDLPEAMNVVMENNAFIDNKPTMTPRWADLQLNGVTLTETPADEIIPAIIADHEGNEDAINTINLSLKNNIMIGNRRGMDGRDLDILLRDVLQRERIILETPADEEFNILNSIASNVVSVKQTQDFVDIMPEGYKVNWDFTYTHPAIMFTMEGDLPQLLFDEFGVGYVEYTGTGDEQTVDVASITVSAAQEWVQVGTTLQMEALVAPENAADKSVTWSVEFITGVATIDVNGLLTGVLEGSVTVKATANDGSGVVGSAEVNVVTEPVNVSELNKNTVKVYPNPSNGLFELTLPGTTNGSTFEVFDILGSRVASGVISGNHTQVNLAGFDKGIYLLRVYSDNQNVSMKITVK